MTWHVPYSHECDSCGASYIPYDSDVPCPRCGIVEKERFDYINQAALSMRYNKEMGGSYTPGAWYAASLGDHVLRLLFKLFDAYEEDKEKRTFESFLDDWLGKIQWGDHLYMPAYMRGLAARLRRELGVP